MNTLLCAIAGVLIGIQCQAAPLCVGDHPARRSPDITYGHMPTVRGYVRDHIVPLCLGGTDTQDNIQYQEVEPSYAKDAKERKMCEAYCRGEITLEDGQAWFRDGKWK